MSDEKSTESEVYDANASHGQNRAGVALGHSDSFDDYVAAHPIDPHCTDELVDDEGPEILARMHARGHDVVATDEPGSESPAQ